MVNDPFNLNLLTRIVEWFGLERTFKDHLVIMFTSLPQKMFCPIGGIILFKAEGA